ncbi:MAG: peptidylprolyl isomerase, partial [Planctomycetota bacterium]
ARAVFQQLREGESFDTLMKNHSQERESSDGRIPDFHRGQYGEAFDAAVASLEPKGTPALVRSGGGWHIVVLLSRRELRFEEVREALQEQLHQAPPSSDEKELFFRRLRSSASIETASSILEKE